jgi:hypothetical protein
MPRVTPRIIALLAFGLLLAGCSPGYQGYGPNGYGSQGGPGGMGSAQGPMPYGDIPGAAPPAGN